MREEVQQMSERVDDVDLLEVIYGRELDPRYLNDGEKAAARRLLIKFKVTLQEARRVMATVRNHATWRTVIVTAAKFEQHELTIRNLARAEHQARPYDQAKPTPSRVLRPEEMYRDRPMHPDMAAKRDELLAKIQAAEAKGFRGPALFREVLGYNFGPGKLGAAEAARQTMDLLPAPAEKTPTEESLPPVFELSAMVAELEITIAELPDPAKPPGILAHVPELIRWCRDNPEAGRAEFERKQLELRTLAAAGVIARPLAEVA
jgi:hypothetical protein